MQRIQKVGIALAVFKPNIEHFIVQLQSIQNQSFSSWVCIITVDSKLKDWIELPQFQPFINDIRFHWIENLEKLGHKKNFEKALKLAAKHSVDALACSDQDDLWYPHKLARLVEELEKLQAFSLVHSDMHVLTESGEILKQTVWSIESRGINQNQPRHFLIRNIVAGCALLMDVRLQKKFPIIPEGFEYHDHWYALVASSLGGVYSISEPLYAYRQHASNVVGVTPFQSIFYMEQKLNFLQVIQKCQKVWQKSWKMKQDFVKQGGQLNFVDRLIFSRFPDLGVGVLILGMIHLRKSKTLARACLARAFGKFCLAFCFRNLSQKE